MARPQAEDFMQGFRFKVKEIGGLMDSIAGFRNVTSPELSFEVAEYREGNMKFKRKQPGLPTVTAVSFQKGAAKKGTTFADWALTKYLGGAAYRTDFSIEIYDQVEDGTSSADKPTIKYNLYEAFPIRVKLVGDLDATASDIMIQELECEVEEVGIVYGTDAEIKAG